MFMTGLITGGVIGIAFGILISSLCVISKSGFNADFKSYECKTCDIKKDGDTSYCLDCQMIKK